MLLTIPGVGSQMVDKLLTNCGSIEEMCFPESLKLVKGLGAKTRERIIEVLSSEDPVHVEASRFKRID